METVVLAWYRRHWRYAEDLSDRAIVIDTAASVGVDPSALDAALDTPELKESFRRSVERTIGLGIFGSPTTVVDGELFWGTDRLSHAGLWMTTGGW